MRLLLATFLLLLVVGAGCVEDKAAKLEEALKAFGMDVRVEGNTIYWEAPGQSPYDVIYGMALAKGACDELSMEGCTLVVLYGEEELGRFSLDELP